MEIFIALTKYNTCLLREEGIHSLRWQLSQQNYVICDAPPNEWIWHKAFLRLVWEQGYNLDAPGSSKMPRGLIGIPLKRGASGARQ